jgi:hypothetical protein
MLENHQLIVTELINLSPCSTNMPVRANSYFLTDLRISWWNIMINPFLNTTTVSSSFKFKHDRRILSVPRKPAYLQCHLIRVEERRNGLRLSWSCLRSITETETEPRVPYRMPCTIFLEPTRQWRPTYKISVLLLGNSWSLYSCSRSIAIHPSISRAFTKANR